MIMHVCNCPRCLVNRLLLRANPVEKRRSMRRTRSGYSPSVFSPVESASGGDIKRQRFVGGSVMCLMGASG